MEMSSAAYASLDPTYLDNFKNPLHLPGDDGLMGVLDASSTSVRFTAHKERIEILPGKRAELLAYHAERDGKTFVNPTFRVQKGNELSAEFTNDLDEETTVH
jgi:FtsP/CotA-like multicopper oxidase with cupredoxin domain